MSSEFPVEAKIRCLYRLFGILGFRVPVTMLNFITETMWNIRFVYRNVSLSIIRAFEIFLSYQSYILTRQILTQILV